MLARLGLPRPKIATKLYGAIALSLAVVYLLAAAFIQFTGRTEETVGRFLDDGFASAMLYARVEVLLEQHMRLVAKAPHAPERGAAEGDEPAYQQLNATLATQLERLGPAPDRRLPSEFAALARSGLAVFQLAGRQERDQAVAAAAEYAGVAAAFKAAVAAERQARVHGAAESLYALAASAHALTNWVYAAAAVMGLLVGPVCLLLLGRVLARIEGIGSALNRLARNDTSVDIPGLASQDEVGQMARSVAVFKAKSIELLQKKAEFERLNLQLDAAINNMPLGLSMFDAQERLLVCNRRYADMYDVPSELTRPGTVHCALWEHRTRRGARHSELPNSAPSGRKMTGEYAESMLIEFGGERVISVSRQPLKGGGWVALHEDITTRRRQEQEITHLARHDPLTGLANRVLFREQLAQALQRLVRGQGFAVLCLDLDRFKSVNDTLGHPVGDILLKQVGERLLACVRHGDLVARLGGDEFAIIQASVRDPNQTETLAQRIVEAIAKSYEIDGHRIDIGTSIGITLAPRDGSDADELLKNADLALYRAKEAGRCGYSFFAPEMNEQIQRRRALEVDLRHALRNDQLELLYQPLVCVTNGKAVSFEALLRWHHPERGDVPPSEFISLAEEIGLIAEIGEWALRQACAQAARWPARVKVAINLSPLQFRKRNLIDVVLQALAASGLPPHRLELEITESAMLEQNQNTHTVLHQLRQLGVRVAMDDFGTGYCSLSNLRSFPFDKIKIDKAFIGDIERNAEARSIVETVIALGNSLGMATVAEGIETYEQLDLVRGWGCAQAQGFLLSPAVPGPEVERLLSEPGEPVQSAA